MARLLPLNETLMSSTPLTPLLISLLFYCGSCVDSTLIIMFHSYGNQFSLIYYYSLIKLLIKVMKLLKILLKVFNSKKQLLNYIKLKQSLMSVTTHHHPSTSTPRSAGVAFVGSGGPEYIDS